MKAYILVQTAVGKSGQVARDMQALDGIISVEPVTGPYDVIAEATGSSTLERLADTVLTAVEGLEGVTRTLTCVVGKSYSA
jgi:DNA-binding Lrp family transcriptional regulator